MKKNKKNKVINKFIPKTQTEKLLLITFILLLILVIVLSIIAINLKQEHNLKKDMNIVIPMLEKDANNTFLVDASKMKKDEIKEYKFMITNYKDKKIAKEELNYNIEVVNNSKAVSIKLYKEKEDKNLLIENKDKNIIKNNKLIKDKKDTDTYYLIMRAKEEPKKEDNISIKITGIN